VSATFRTHPGESGEAIRRVGGHLGQRSGMTPDQPRCGSSSLPVGGNPLYVPELGIVLGASGFRSDVTVFRLNALSRRKTGSEPAFRRNTAERVHTIEAAAPMGTRVRRKSKAESTNKKNDLRSASENLAQRQAAPAEAQGRRSVLGSSGSAWSRREATEDSARLDM
jgi:hypothetical protein